MSVIGMLSELADVGLTEAKLNKAVAEHIPTREAVIAKANEVLRLWQSIAPVSDRGPHPLNNGYTDDPGDYKRSIHVTYERGPAGELTAKVGTRDPKARWLEYGSVHNKDFGYAARVAALLGGEVVGAKRSLLA